MSQAQRKLKIIGRIDGLRNSTMPKFLGIEGKKRIIT